MKAINIDDTEKSYTSLILTGLKTVETRNSRSLKSLVGQRVGIISTCKHRKAKLVGYVDIIEEITYINERQFRKNFLEHFVEEGSKYDIKEGHVKYGYVLSNPEICTPVSVKEKGIVIRNI